AVAPDLCAVHLQRNGFGGFRPDHLHLVLDARERQRGRVAVPSRGQTGIEGKALAPAFYAEDSFHRGAVKPARGPGIPGPAAASALVLGINVGRDNVWLD